jgi:hypothetical protein
MTILSISLSGVTRGEVSKTLVLTVGVATGFAAGFAVGLTAGVAA